MKKRDNLSYNRFPASPVNAEQPLYRPQHNAALNVASAAVTGTTAMTLFSYLASTSKEKQFREPEILAQLVKRISPAANHTTSAAEGWAAHYSVGFGFNTLYHFFWQRTKMKPTLFSGLLLGGISGLIGAGIWKAIFKVHPFPPHLDRNSYYSHLLLAHLVFGVFSAVGYRLPDRTKELAHQSKWPESVNHKLVKESAL